jgi:hypothetical protein
LGGGAAFKTKGPNRERALGSVRPISYLEAEKKSEHREEIINDHGRMHICGQLLSAREAKQRLESVPAVLPLSNEKGAG